MKVFLFTDSLGSGGAQRQLVGLAVMLQKHGYQVKVCTYQNFNFFKEYLDENNVPNEIINEAAYTKKRIFAVRNYFIREKPEWVIAYQETPSLVACAAKLLGCRYKLLVSERNTTQIENWSSKVRFSLYKVSDAIVPNSYTQEKYMLTHYPWMKKKLTTITNYVDLERFSYTKHSRRVIPEIITPASLMTSKNALGYIEACAILKKRNVKFHASWYGISPHWLDYYKLCLSRIIEHGLEDYISLLEKTKAIEQKYREADYMCLPSFYEGTPNVICEAISTGLPIMCSNVCDNPFYVKEARNGVLFDPRDPNNIANKIQDLLNISDDTYSIYRKESRKIAEETLQETIFIDKYLSILNGCKK